MHFPPGVMTLRKPWWYFTSPEVEYCTLPSNSANSSEGFAQDIDQDIQATAMGHAYDDFLGAVGTATLYHFRQHGDEAFAAFEAETLGARVLGAQGFSSPSAWIRLLSSCNRTSCRNPVPSARIPCAA